MKDTAILTVKLLLITAIVAALLGAVNMITKPIIAENAEKSTNETMKELLPDADKFDLDGTKIPDSKDPAVTVGKVYCGLKDDGTVVGYVASAVCSEGYGGDITVMVGVDPDCRITQAKVTEMDETPGLGAKSQSDWIDQYSGLGENIQVNKNGSAASAEYKIDAISGATITSKAVTKAVNAVLDAVRVVIDDNAPAALDGLPEQSETEILLDENGEPVLDENGEPVLVPVAAADEEPATDEEQVTENSEDAESDENTESIDEAAEGGAAE
ncbi:MAG: RnfABCDGE type electron transport complex subunit G [Clostridiales bacterium]|nr:RnfABCDGE type electron transport complex subunit G [Clostridiales bacterium]